MIPQNYPYNVLLIDLGLANEVQEDSYEKRKLILAKHLAKNSFATHQMWLAPNNINVEKIDTIGASLEGTYTYEL